jgi:alpha-L-rhamnosidase
MDQTVSKVIATLGCLLALNGVFTIAHASIRPQGLTCEYRANPSGIDVRNPRLSWQLTSSTNGEIQTAYRILVATSEQLLNADSGNVWDTKVQSGQTVNIPFKGAPLKSGEKYFWKIKAWGRDGAESGWSETAIWSTGLLNESEWRAKWVGLNKFVGSDDSVGLTRLSARYLRKEFQAGKEILSATAYICGLGLYELSINGRKAGNEVLVPAQTQFDKKVFYYTYDVTGHLVQGSNAIGVALGNGRYFTIRSWVRNFGFPKLLFQMEVKYRDGSKQIIVSDESWKITADGPLTENNEWDGEKYDARKELKGWDKPGFNDKAWRSVELLSKPAEEIRAQMNEPMRVIETIQPVSLKEARPGVYIFDMGQNMAGWVRLRVKGEAGTKIRLRFGESMDAETLFTANLRSAKATDEYICRGEEIEEWHPRFVYHGFRFVELTGFPGTPDLKTIQGEVIHDDVARIGTFSSSNAVMNQTFKNAVWGIRDSYKGFPTDCPQRDERHGWLGDRGMGSRGESFVLNIANLYAKWIRDMCDAQADSGSILDVAPSHVTVFADNVTWAGTPIVLLDMLLTQYADHEILRQSYPNMKRWYDYMMRKYSRDGLMPRDTYGDWCVPPDEPGAIHTADPAKNTLGPYIGSAYFYFMTNTMKRFAALLGNTTDELYFDRRARAMKTAFNKAYFNRQSRTYSNNTATANVLALAFGLVEGKDRAKVIDNLVETIEARSCGHIPTGLIGGQFLMRTLTAIGRADIALRFATQTDYPSWGYMAQHGATTIWELWNGNTADPAMNSQNHVMLLGDLLTWYFENLAGIKSTGEEPGFKHLIMNPILISGLDSVSASHVSPYGPISSSWKINGGQFTWDISIPVNVTAEVFVPTGKPGNVFVNGQSIAEASNLKIDRMENGRLIVRVPSGHYQFSSSGFSVVTAPKQVSPPRFEQRRISSAEPVSFKMTCATEGATIRYTTDNSTPTEKSRIYEGRLEIAKSAVVRAKAFKSGYRSSYEDRAEVDIHGKRMPVKSITHITRYTTDYAVARGDSALIDGEEGSMSYIDKKWVGYRKDDMEVILDMGKPVSIHQISMRFISSPKVWVFLPKGIQISTSNNLDRFEEAAQAHYGKPKEIYDIRKYSFPLNNIKARYIKVRAKNIGKLPAWHSLVGNDAYMFVDEICVE